MAVRCVCELQHFRVCFVCFCAFLVNVDISSFAVDCASELCHWLFVAQRWQRFCGISLAHGHRSPAVARTVQALASRHDVSITYLVRAGYHEIFLDTRRLVR